MIFKCGIFIISFLLHNIVATSLLGENFKNNRRQMHQSFGTILGAPTRVEHLPEAEPLLPGHSLNRPSLGMLKSAVKYPHKEVATLYGSVDNVGLAYNGKNERVMYSDFRRSPRLDDELNIVYENDQGMPSLLFLQIHLDRLNNLLRSVEQPMPRGIYGFRKMNKEERPTKKDYKANPGNPFTVHRDRYLKNYVWNLAMTGDHINLNPNAPEFKEPMPSDMVGIRKWWYFHQDDYKPFTR